MGTRENRRHRPGRGLEAVKYRFEVVSDYGAFRDLQRHRLLTVQWQELTPLLGAGMPEEVGLAGWRRRVHRGPRGVPAGVGGAACRRRRPAPRQYALCLAFRLRYSIDMNAREAMHLIELRSGDRAIPHTARWPRRCTG